MTEEELKETAKKAKAAEMAVKLNSASNSKQTTDSDSKEQTKQQMKSDAKNAQIITNDPSTYLSLREETAARLKTQLDSPVTDANKVTTDNETLIGPFSGFLLDEQLEKNKRYTSDFRTPKIEIEREERVINNRNDLDQYLAYYDHADKKIYLPDWQLSEEMQNEFAQKNPADLDENFRAVIGDPTTEIAIMRHENTHFLHNIRGQMDDDKHPHQTAEMRVETNYVTEKTAYAVECLSLANIYKNCKESGMEIIQINGKEQPLSTILSQIPGLQETVEKNGFDPQDPKSVSRIVKLASANWDNNLLETYRKGEEYKSSKFAKNADKYTPSQFEEAAESANDVENIVNQINAAKKHQKILLDMTKQLDIGYNTQIDIPDDCLADILPKKEITQDILKRSDKTFSPSTEGLIAIDDYLTEKGLKTDKEKDQYLKTQYANIVNRAPDADLKLKELMLACGNADNNEIAYTDGLIVKNQNGILTVSNDDGYTSYPLSPFDAKVDELTQNKANAKATKNTTTLTSAQITTLTKANQR